MASIVFHADLNTSKLDSSIKESKKTVGEWVKDIEKAGDQAEQGLGKMTRSFKEAISEQKNLVKSIEKDVKDLQKAYENAIAGKGKQEAWDNLRGAQKALAEEQGTLLNLQKLQVESNQRIDTSQTSVIASLGKWALGLATVGAAMKLFKGVMESTETTAHFWHTAISEARTVLDVFLKSIATADFSDFGKRLKESVSSAKKFVEDMEYISNIRRQYTLEELDLQNEIGAQREIAYANDNVSNEAKLAAMDKVLEKMQQKADLELDIAQKTQEAVADKTAGVNKMTEEELRYAIENYDKVVEVGEKYNRLKRVDEEYQKGLKRGLGENQYVHTAGPGSPLASVSKEGIDEIRKEIDKLGPDAAKLGAIEKKLGEVNSKERQAIFESIKAVKEANNQIYAERRLIVRRKGAIENEIIAANKKAQEEAKDLQLQVDKQTKLLSEAVKTGNTEEAKSIAAKIVLLKEELSVREKLVKSYITAAGVEGMPIPAQSQIPGMPSVIPASGKNKSWDTLRREMTSLQDPNKKVIEQNEARQKGYNKATEESLERQRELRDRIAQSIGEFVNRLSDALGLDQQTAKLLGDTMDAIQRAASGDFIGAGLSMLTGVLSALPDHAKRFEVEIQKMNDLLEEQQRLIDQAGRIGGEQEARQAEINTLKAEWEKLQKEQEYWTRKFDNSIGGIFYGKRKKNMEYFTQAAQDAKVAYEEALQEFDDFISGGTTQNTIADAIAEGFREGKSSVDDFADYLNNILLDAVTGVFTKEVLGEEINKLTANIGEYLKDNKLTTDERDALKKEFQEIAASKEQLWKDLSGELDLGSIGSPKGLTGIVGSLTEDTGSELAGLMRRISDDVRVSRDYSKAGITHLAAIDTNTYNTVEELKKAVIELKSINSNTKQVPVGAL